MENTGNTKINKSPTCKYGILPPYGHAIMQTLCEVLVKYEPIDNALRAYSQRTHSYCLMLQLQETWT